MRQKEGEIMGCKYATFNPDSGRWNCSVSGDGCMYLTPNSKRCAEDYGEGPDVNMEQNKDETSEEKRKELSERAKANFGKIGSALLKDSDSNAISKDELQDGTWYIED
jgi:hypothetical protein